MPRLPEGWLHGWRALGLRQRLLRVLMPPLTLLMIVGTGLDYRLSRNTADAAYDHALADAAYDIENHVRNQSGPPYSDLDEEAKAILRTNAPDKVFYAIRDQNGQLLAGDPGLPQPQPEVRLAGDEKIRFIDGKLDGKKVRSALLWIFLDQGSIAITVTETTKRRQQSSEHILSTLLLQNLATIAITLLAVFIGVRQGLQPLGELEQELAARSAGDLREIELATAPAEIRSVLQRLNELFGLLRGAADVQQRFIGDAAHQLRTPLTGLQNQLDLASAEGLFRNHPELLANIEEATSRLGHLLTQLLAYARTEAQQGPNSTAFAAVSLENLLERSASEFIDVAIAKNIDLGFDIHTAEVYGIGWMLQEALANLIDNAIRYTPVGGIVTVRCGETNGLTFLEVEDNGPGIPVVERSLVRERFYRMSGTSGNGCGLGLAIVDEIARVHHAVLGLQTSPSGGLQARITFSSSIHGSVTNQ